MWAMASITALTIFVATMIIAGFAAPALADHGGRHFYVNLQENLSFTDDVKTTLKAKVLGLPLNTMQKVEAIRAIDNYGTQEMTEIQKQVYVYAVNMLNS